MSNTQQDRAEINRRNSQYSTGPITPEGKQRSALNALRHGLTSHVVVMSDEDHDAYDAHLRGFTSEHQPKGATETQLVQALADAACRLNRVSALEHNLLMFGVTHEDLWFHETTYQMREALGVANTLDRHTKALATLSLHGQRLSRQFERTLALLQKLQKERRTEQRQPIEQPVTPLQMPPIKEESYAATAHGFVFSDDEIEPLPGLENRAFSACKAQKEAFEKSPNLAGRGTQTDVCTTSCQRLIRPSGTGFSR
jgi:hypothetical protein